MTLLARQRRRRPCASFIHVPRRARALADSYLSPANNLSSRDVSPRVGYASCNNNGGTLAHIKEKIVPSNVPRSSRCEHSRRGAEHATGRLAYLERAACPLNRA